MNLHAILKVLLTTYGDKQELLAKELGVSQPTISRWANGGKIVGENRDKLINLARERGMIALDEHGNLPSRVRAPEDHSDRIEEIDVTGGLGGGGLAMLETSGGFAAEVVRDFWRLPTWVLNRFNAQPGHIKAFPCQGDSMEPTIDDGDVVFADIRHRVPSPPGIYVIADQFGGVVVKRLEVVSRPNDDPVVVRVISDNTRHVPQELTLDEINIVGRYVGRFTT